MVEDGNGILRLLDRGWQILEAIFLGPELQASDFLLSATELGVDLVADAALEGLLLVEGDELQTAGFTNAVLMGAVVLEVSPLPITAGENDAFEVAHVSKSWGWSLSLRQCVYLLAYGQLTFLCVVNAFQGLA
jgi:hypothetical protein